MAHSRRQFPARSQRTTLWNQGPGSQTSTSFSSSTTSVLGLGQTALGGVTLVRLRGNMQALLNLGGGGEGFHCAIGLGVVTNDAFSVGGVTSLPNPFDDIDWTWWYHRIFDVHSRSSFNSADPGGLFNLDIDSKAMRKMKPNETVFASLQVIESGTASMDVYFDTRMLFKLA